MRRRVQLDPASIAFAALAEEYRRVGRYDEAIEACRSGLQRHPAYLSARVTLGRALIETGDYDAAREELDTVLRSAPENIAALRGLAQINERLGHSAEMDPQLAEMMREEAERVALAPPPPLPPPAPQPAIALGTPVDVDVVIDLDALTGPDPEPEPEHVPPAQLEPQPHAEPEFRIEPDLRLVEPEPELEAPEESVEIGEPIPVVVFEPPSAAGPDPAVAAALLRLERFLAAIDNARHA